MAERSESDDYMVASNLGSHLTSLYEGSFQNSSWVEQAREKLNNVLNFKALVRHFLQLRDCLYIAHNDAVVAGDKFNDVLVGIQKLSLETASLCSASVALLGDFENACKDAVTDINNGYSHLCEDQDELALITFQQLSKRATEMEEESLNLSKKFHTLSLNVEAVLEKILTLKSIQEVAKEKMEEEMKKLSLRKARENDKISEAILAEKKAIMNKPELKADENILFSGTLFDEFVNGIQKLSCTFFPTCTVSTQFRGPLLEDRQVVVGAASGYDEANKIKLSAIDKRDYLEAEIAKFGDGKAKADQAAKTLHDAAGWLKELSSLMLQTSQFWKQLKSHCHSIVDRSSNLELQMVHVVIKKSGEDRMKVLKSAGFKRTMLQFCGNWLSLQQVCTESKQELQITEKRLFEDLKSNPTLEEAKENLLRVINNYDSSLDVN